MVNTSNSGKPSLLHLLFSEIFAISFPLISAGGTGLEND